MGRDEYLETRVTMLEGECESLRRHMAYFEAAHAEKHQLEALALEKAHEASEERISMLKWMVSIGVPFAVVALTLFLNRFLSPARTP